MQGGTRRFHGESIGSRGSQPRADADVLVKGACGAVQGVIGQPRVVDLWRDDLIDDVAHGKPQVPHFLGEHREATKGDEVQRNPSTADASRGGHVPQGHGQAHFAVDEGVQVNEWRLLQVPRLVAKAFSPSVVHHRDAVVALTKFGADFQAREDPRD